MTTPGDRTDTTTLNDLVGGEPVFATVLRAAGGSGLFLVGGSVRDAMLGRPQAGFDLDLAVDGPVAELARELDPDAVFHERFDTAEIRIDGRAVDIARTRTERYPHPGALPVVEPARIEDDLGRRDFTINALALPIERPRELIDPHGGRGDLDRGLLRVLHPDSFVDDPTRALRAARYAARLGFDLEMKTAELVGAADLSKVSKERVDNELSLIAAEPCALEALRLAAAWGLLEAPEQRLELCERAIEISQLPGWREFTDRREIVLTAVHGPGREEIASLIPYPGSPSAAVETVARASSTELVLARAAGAEWLDRWLNDWRGVEPEVTGDDLLRAGIPRGPAIGAGLKAALEARLDAGLQGREAQLERAVAAAKKLLREASGP